MPNQGAFIAWFAVENNKLIFGGDDGVYEWSVAKMDLHKITDEATTAIKAGLQLSGQQIKAIEDGYDEAKPYNASFNREPKSFIGKDGYIYAISERTVECADSLGRIIATIELPERHLSRPRNKSCRALCLVKDSFLYVAPGGNQLYRIPLAPYFCSEESFPFVSTTETASMRYLPTMTSIPYHSGFQMVQPGLGKRNIYGQ